MYTLQLGRTHRIGHLRAGACDRILRSERSKSMLDRILFTRVVFNSVIIQFFMEQCAHQFQGSLKVSVEQSTFYENLFCHILKTFVKFCGFASNISETVDERVQSVGDSPKVCKKNQKEFVCSIVS